MIGDFIEAVRVKLGIDADIWLTGAYFTETNEAPPCYVWVPTSDRIGASLGSGAFASKSPRPLFTRYAGVDCHVWGDTLANTETMAHNVIAAAYSQLGADGEIDGIRWQPEGLNDRGFIAIVSFSVPIPITAVAIESVTTGTFDTIECDDEPTVPADGFIECCEEIDP